MDRHSLACVTALVIVGSAPAAVVQHPPAPARQAAATAQPKSASPAGAAKSPAGAARRTIWDGVFSAEQAAAGKALYVAHCQSCHGPTGRGGPGGTGVTGAAFNKMWEGKTLRDLFDFTYGQMPPGSAGSIGNQQDYLNIVAHILMMHGAAPGTTKLLYNPDTLENVAIVRKP